MNDPLFLRQPKGVVPTERAKLLATPVADILERARQVMANAEGFDPRKSVRRFVVGAPDAVTAVILPSLLAELRRDAPGIDLGVRNLVGQFETALSRTRRAVAGCRAAADRERSRPIRHAHVVRA